MVTVETSIKRLTLHWSYIISPAVILFLSILLAIYFYYHLPAEVALNFRGDSHSDQWLSREITIVLFLVPQFLLTLLAIAITWGVAKLSTMLSQESNIQTKQKRILVLMGNIFVLPQLILCFAMIDIFSYNSYQIHIMPMWIFLLIAMGLATIILGLFLALAMSTARR